jgi:lysophospholipase L1-like esterase
VWFIGRHPLILEQWSSFDSGAMEVMKDVTKSWRTNPLLVVASILVALAAAEASLQALGFNESVVYSVWPPGLEQEIAPDEHDTPGVSDTPHRFVITASGYRGRPIENAALRIAAFGGSTTESLFIAEERSWPRQLERILSGKLGTSVWVGNFGKSGRNTRQHVLDAKYVLPQFSIQIALFLVGGNDLGNVIGDRAAEPMSLEAIQSDTYVQKSLVVRHSQADRIKLLGLVRAAERALSPPAASPELIHVTTEFYRRQRKLRAERAGYSSELPDLNPFLDEYARNLAEIGDLVRAGGVLPVFVSQPSLWSSNVSPDTDALFWWGAVDGWPPKRPGGYYYSSEALNRMLTAYNQRLQLVAKQQNILLIDAAERLPKNPKYYYDQIHYNEAGSEAVAEIIAGGLLSNMNEGTNAHP